MTAPPARDPYRFSLGPLFVVGVAWPWMNALLVDWGYRPYRGWGIALGLGIIAACALTAWLIDYGLARVGVARANRSALWLGAALGPYAGLLVAERWGLGALSHAVGVGATLAGFGVGLALERFLGRRRAS